MCLVHSWGRLFRQVVTQALVYSGLFMEGIIYTKADHVYRDTRELGERREASSQKDSIYSAVTSKTNITTGIRKSENAVSRRSENYLKVNTSESYNKARNCNCQRSRKVVVGEVLTVRIFNKTSYSTFRHMTWCPSRLRISWQRGCNCCWLIRLPDGHAIVFASRRS